MNETASPTATSRMRQLLPLVVAAAPPVVLVLLVLRYHVDVPVYDEWDFVPLLEKAINGRVSFEDLWAQHAEHRWLVPRAILLPLALASGWDITYELLTSILLALGVFALFVHQARATFRATSSEARWLVPIASLTVFSPIQWGNWLVGWQVQAFANVAAVAGGLVVLAKPRLNWWRFVVALSLGLAATYSHTNGLAFWGIGFIVLLVQGRRVLAGIWLGVGSLAVALYLRGYVSPSFYSSPLEALGRPVTYVSYVLTALGAPLGATRLELALPAGLAGCLILVSATWWLVRHGVGPRLLIPYLALALYVVCGALMTGLGRSQYGSAYALSSRYTTVSSLLWLCDALLLYLVAARDRWARESAAGSRRSTYAATAVLAGLVLAVIVSSATGLRSFRHWKEYFEPARSALVALEDPGDPLLKRLWGESDVGWERALFLREHKLSVFRDAD